MVNSEMPHGSVTLAILRRHVIERVYGKGARNFPYFAELEDGSRWWAPLKEDIDFSQTKSFELIEDLRNIALSGNLENINELVFHDKNWGVVIDISGDVPIIRLEIDRFYFIIAYKLVIICKKYKLCFVSSSCNNIIDGTFDNFIVNIGF